MKTENNIINNILTSNKPQVTLDSVFKLCNGIYSTVNNFNVYFKKLLNNQSVLNNKLDCLLNQHSVNNNTMCVVDYMTPRQLYRMYKRGYTMDQIVYTSGYTVEQIQNKINEYIKNNL